PSSRPVLRPGFPAHAAVGARARLDPPEVEGDVDLAANAGPLLVARRQHGSPAYGHQRSRAARSALQPHWRDRASGRADDAENGLEMEKGAMTRALPVTAIDGDVAYLTEKSFVATDVPLSEISTL
ncbi:hypothetical protein, partial [Dokdonella sp.]|uniref:hypothetical protein n=1 Tax=Dokdonella sp. TaxID=2291710 RepID=UPI002F427682